MQATDYFNAIAIVKFQYISKYGRPLMIRPNAAAVFSSEILYILPSRYSLTDMNILVLFCLCAILPLGGLY